MNAPVTRFVVDVRGIVQGVGFRPTVKRLADEAGLGGWVQNRSGSVCMELIGPPIRVRRFLDQLPSRLPSPARLENLTVREECDCHEDVMTEFHIRASEMEESMNVSIPADMAMCPDCRREVFDPGDRRYGYPFTTCTLCGPRYTVTDAMPYDRERTTMRVFDLCPDCRREYDDPADRRFHAESIACPACGPRLTLIRPNGEAMEGNPLKGARAALAAGLIVAVRGIGGYLLAVNARNERAIRTLRDRKRRPHKPLAVMAASPEILRRQVRTTKATRDVLESLVAPIVICSVKPGADLPVPLLSPDTNTLGVMLPTTPLHALLFAPLPGDPVPAFEWLVMTSGNRRGEPICIGNDEALRRLGDVADLILTHDREVRLRNDDSVLAPRGESLQVWRRARGFAPNARTLHRPLSRVVLAMGAELKNVVALGFGDRVVLSPHVGDLETPEAMDALIDASRRLPEYLEHEPEAVAVDLHPDYRATRVGRDIAERFRLPLIEVQHHHAHAVSALAEHGLDRGLALVFDGTGMGADGAIWGAELLDISESGYDRLATFAATPLPGGDAAVRRPARQLFARWVAAGLTPSPAMLERSGIDELDAEIWTKQLMTRLNTASTHAAGRLFDAASAALGFAPDEITYEAQAAIRLETAAKRARVARGRWPYDLLWNADRLEVDWSEAFLALAENPPPPRDRDGWAYGFHLALARAVRDMARHGRERTRQSAIALSGGVWMNGLLARLAVQELKADGFEVFVHGEIPPNDGGIAFGQAVIAGR